MPKFGLSMASIGAVALICLIYSLRVHAGEVAKVEPDKASYKIMLSSVGGAPIFFKDATNVEGNLAWLDPPQIWIYVDEPDVKDLSVGFTPKWEYLMGPLGVGDEFVMQGRMYKIAAIDTKKVKFIPPYQFDGFCREDFCNPSAEIVRLPQVISSFGRGAIILSMVRNYFKLPKGPGVAIWKGYECHLDLYLNSVKNSGKKYVANFKSLLRSSRGVSADSGCHEKIGVEHAKVVEGDTVDFGDFGRFMVESILPAQSRHPDWVVLVPAK